MVLVSYRFECKMSCHLCTSDRLVDKLVYVDRSSAQFQPNPSAVVRENGLREYDGAYVELDLREALPLATLDDQLLQVATRIGSTLVAT